MPAPVRPKIYHIVHVDNLASIIKDGYLWPDAQMVQRQGGTAIGMEGIKKARRTLPVHCHQGLHVGDCTPFYFCPRSVMLYVIHRANNPELTYRGGQQPIIHLEADLHKTVLWAKEKEQLWAFSLSNARARYAKFRNKLTHLSEINWGAVVATDFRPTEIKESKQAEFLVQKSFSWHLVERIGVLSHEIAQRVYAAMNGAAHRPGVEIMRKWYY